MDRRRAAKIVSTAGAMISASVLPGLYAATSAQKPIDDDVHGIADFHQLFFAFHCTGHVELLIEGDEFERGVRRV